MNHRDPGSMLRNALDAIPRPDEAPLSAHQIFKRQGKPRLPHRQLEAFCEYLASEGYVEVIQSGYMRLYRVSIAYGNVRQYNRVATIDPFAQALRPLTKNQAVRLWMFIPQHPARKKTRRDTGRRLVGSAPGALLGMSTQLLMVSILGSGSCIVWVIGFRRSRDIANLILAGMPARLARELMNQIHRVFDLI